MTEEELAALNAQISQLIGLQSDAAEIMKAKFASLHDPITHVSTGQKPRSSTHTEDAHGSTVGRLRQKPRPKGPGTPWDDLPSQTYTHELGTAPKRMKVVRQRHSSLLSRFLSFVRSKKQTQPRS